MGGPEFLAALVSDIAKPSKASLGFTIPATA
jgi:hypothetical protein